MTAHRPAKLTHSFVKSISTPGRYGDGRGGHGLSILVKQMANGRWSKTWAQRVNINGRLYSIGLGSFPTTSLAQARASALDNASRIAQGEDIRKQPKPVPTLTEAFEAVIATRSPSWRGKQTTANWRRALRFCDTIADLPVSKITAADLLSVLTQDWSNTARMAMDVCSKFSTVMDWCVVQEHRDSNPVNRNFRRQLPKTPPAKHHKALDFYNQLGAALATIRDADAWWSYRYCTLFLGITCVRSENARLATWDEIDFKNATWKLSPERMKFADEPYRVPLPTQAMSILELAKARTRDSHPHLVFPPPKHGKSIYGNQIAKLFKDDHIDSTPHGMRQNFKNWASEDNRIAEAVQETILAHMPSDEVLRAYRTSDFFEQRKPVMQQWADYLTSTMGHVIALKDQ